MKREPRRKSTQRRKNTWATFYNPLTQTHTLETHLSFIWSRYQAQKERRKQHLKKKKKKDLVRVSLHWTTAGPKTKSYKTRDDKIAKARRVLDRHRSIGWSHTFGWDLHQPGWWLPQVKVQRKKETKREKLPIKWIKVLSHTTVCGWPDWRKKENVPIRCWWEEVSPYSQDSQGLTFVFFFFSSFVCYFIHTSC